MQSGVAMCTKAIFAWAICLGLTVMPAAAQQQEMPEFSAVAGFISAARYDADSHNVFAARLERYCKA
jgi:hypothetical protein